MNRSLTTGLAACTLLLGLAGCGGEPEVHHEQFMGLGTVVSIQVAGADEEDARQAIEAIREDLEYIHGGWHPWREGTVARNNMLLETGGEFTSSPGVLRLMQNALPLYEASDGLFNPTLARLTEAWGFHEEEPAGPPPDDATIAELVAAAPSLHDVTIDGVRVRSSNPAVQFDFGGFAKGVATDRAIERLRAHGIEHGIINLGGDLRGIGRKGERPWRIGIRDPRGEEALASLELRDGDAVFTSGDYERYFEHEGRRYHHILDPRTGHPATGTTSVTVLHDNGAEADAAATALFVAAADEWPAIARAMGIDAVMRIDDAGRLFMTPAMAERVELLDDHEAETVPLP